MVVVPAYRSIALGTKRGGDFPGHGETEEAPSETDEMTPVRQCTNFRTTPARYEDYVMKTQVAETATLKPGREGVATVGLATESVHLQGSRGQWFPSSRVQQKTAQSSLKGRIKRKCGWCVDRVPDGASEKTWKIA